MWAASEVDKGQGLGFHLSLNDTYSPAGVNRLGVFGGSFDQPHPAHVAVVESAMGQLQLDRVHVVPTGQAWHKTRGLTAAQHRVAMTRLAFEHLPKVVVDEREVLREGPSYPVDTLKALHTEYPHCLLYPTDAADE